MNAAALILVLFFHHSFAAEFDSAKSVELKGAVTRLDWVNPHAWIYLDVKDEKGDSLKSCDSVAVTGSQAKDGSHIANARTVRLAGGKRIFNAGSSGDPPQ